MNVLMTADAVGGVWTYALELTRSCAPLGVHVTLATMGARPSAAQRAQARALPNVSLHESDYRLEWQPDPWHDVDRAGEWLLRLADDCAADLVHLNGYAHAPLPWSVPVLVAAHSCVRSWWRAVRGGDAPPEWDEYTRRVEAGLGAADLVVAPSSAMLQALRREYRWQPRDTRVIANGRSGGCAGGAREPFVLTAGRLWDEGKNVAAVAAASRLVPWPIYAAGDLEVPGGRPCDAGALRTLGRLTEEELAAWMSRASIFAAPARYEPFGLSAVEAALAGCALVLGDIPSLREVWEDDALFVDPCSPHDLARGLGLLIQGEALRHVLATRARARAQRFAPAAMARAYVDAYHDLITPSRAATRAHRAMEACA